MRLRFFVLACPPSIPLKFAAMAADRAVSVTIYADDLALIQDRSDVEIKGGRQRIEFQDVSAQIRPETASLTARSPPTRP